MLIGSGQAFEIGLLRQAGVLHVGAAPQSVTGDNHDHRAPFCVHHHGREAVTRACEVMVDIGGDEALGPGKAVEGEAEAFAHRAARPIRADHIIRAQFLTAHQSDGHSVSILRQRLDPRAEADFGIGKLFQARSCNAGQHVLAHIDVVVELRAVAEQVEPVANVLVRLLDQPGVIVLDDAGGLGLLANAEPFQPVEQRPVIDRRAGAIDDVVASFEQQDVHTGLREAERGQEARGAAAHHDHVMHLSLPHESMAQRASRRKATFAPARTRLSLTRVRVAMARLSRERGLGASATGRGDRSARRQLSAAWPL